MAFTAKDVQTLREMSGVGMMDCKKALTEADGNMERAAELLREKGLATAAKKAGRIAAEGIVTAVAADGIGVVVEVNSETDFVSKNENFQNFVKGVAQAIMTNRPADIEALGACTYPESDMSVADMLREKVLTIGENLQLRRFVIFEGGVSVPYVHMGGKIGVLVNLNVEGISDMDKVVAIGKDVCMQIAAMSPAHLDRSEVTGDTLEKEREILLAQAINDGKPQQVAEKIVSGRINKYYEENCLIEQAFVKENKISVGAYVEREAAAAGGKITVTRFVRMEKGEGLQKKEENFAEEIAKQLEK